MKSIRLTKGRVAFVDERDYEAVNKYRWYCHNGRNGNFYAARRDSDNRMILMHRLITDCPKGMVVDHINRNGLDNRRDNLRVCTNSQNLLYRPSRNPVKGVSLHKPTGKWRVRLHVDRKEKHIGLFVNMEEAKQAYAEAARRYHGEFAWLK